MRPPPTTPRRPPRERLAAAERRRTIVEAALKVFAERGYHAAALDDIAAEAGITKPIIYQHFASKRDLHIHLLATQTDALLAAVAAASAQPGADTHARLRAGIDAFFAFVEREPFARQLLFRDAATDPQIAAAHHHAQHVATQAIAAALASDPDLLRDRPDRDQALEVTAQMLKTGLNGVAAWWWQHPDTPRAWLVDRIMDVTFTGLAHLRQPLPQTAV